MISGGEKRSFVLSITLTELALLLFFLLLFAAVSEIREVERERDQRAEEKERLEEQIAAIADTLNVGPDRLSQLLAQTVELQTQLDSSRDRVIKLRSQVDELRSEAEGLLQLIRQQEETDDDDFVKLVRRAARNSGREGQFEKLREVMSELEFDRDSIASRLQNCSAQVLNCSRRLERAGMGFPPCWADTQGKPVYMYEVTLREDVIEVEPTWPSNRDAEARAINGALTLAGKTVTRREFSRLAQPILDWSKSQEPECRHFVTIRDTPDMSKDAFKSGLLTVEHFFYKYLSPDTYGTQ